MKLWGPRLLWPNYNNGQSTVIGNSASVWTAYGINAPAGNKTLSTFYVYMGGVGGTPSAANIRAELREASGMYPGGTVIETRNASAIPGGPGIMAFPGFTSVLTAGKRYWIVIRNFEAVPGSNYVNLFVLANISNLQDGYETSNASSTNAGSSWTNYGTKVVNAMWEFSDGSTLGICMKSVYSTNGNNPLYGQRAIGQLMTPPRTMKVGAVTLSVRRNNNPGGLEARIYQGNTLVATSVSFDQENLVNFATSGAILEFASAVTLTAGTAYRIVLCTTGASGDASNTWTFGGMVVASTSSPHLAGLPFGGAIQKTLTTDKSAGTIIWTQTADDLPDIGLILDEDDPHPSSSGGVPRIGSRLQVFRS